VGFKGDRRCCGFASLREKTRGHRVDVWALWDPVLVNRRGVGGADRETSLRHKLTPRTFGMVPTKRAAALERS